MYWKMITLLRYHLYFSICRFVISSFECISQRSQTQLLHHSLLPGPFFILWCYGVERTC